MSYVFHRHCHSELATIASGHGVYLYDEQGNRYFDGCGGAAVSNLGHSNLRVKSAIQEQLAKVPFCHSGFFTNEPAEALAKALCLRAPGHLSHVYFSSGGSEAIEAAIKVARQYFVERGMPDKCQLIARKQSYHGNTLGALATGGNAWRRAPFLPLLVPTHHIAPCYEYRLRLAGESESAFSERMAAELEKKILEIGPNHVMAFVAEPVVGATAGAVPATKGYFEQIRTICDRYDVLLILDEVMCGMGRTGELFACDAEGIAPDIMTMAKGLTAGYMPLGATLVHEKIYRQISDGSGFFQHGHTFMAHPMACAAGLATLEVIEEQQLLSRVKTMGEQLQSALRSNLESNPVVGDIRGRGLFIGIELVADKQSKKPFPPDSKLDQLVKQIAMAKGLMIYPMGGTIDGQNGHHILVAPPFILSYAEMEELVRLLCSTLEQLAHQTVR